MRYVQVNSVSYGSTGAVMRDVAAERAAAGDECWQMWGRGRKAATDREFRYGTWMGWHVDAFQTRLDGMAGLHSGRATGRLLAKLDDVRPDVVHLHNLHGYHLDYERLFSWLAASRCDVVWTLHDCWAITGHCAHFQAVGCSQWKSACAGGGACPQLRVYPKTFASSRSCERGFARKRDAFTSVPPSRLTLVTPSRWLAGVLGESFLRGYPVRVRPNRVDTSVFKPVESDVRERLGLGSRPVVLGVASRWTERKGLGDLLRLREELPPEVAIVVVGLSLRQVRALPENVVGLGHTGSASELAEIYSASDVLFNPTQEDTFPSVNLEAQACGTPVVTYDVGGCAETLSLPASRAVGSFDEALAAIGETLGARS